MHFFYFLVHRDNKNRPPVNFGARRPMKKECLFQLTSNRRRNKPKAKPAVGLNVLLYSCKVSSLRQEKVHSVMNKLRSSEGLQENFYLNFFSNSTYSAEVSTPSR